MNTYSHEKKKKKKGSGPIGDENRPRGVRYDANMLVRGEPQWMDE